jgi:S-(hydroxymethyl)glutathione dehydrogenase/alcohol dehydrogenase
MSEIPAQMRAAVVLGEEERFTVVTIPTPSAKKGEALVKVLSCGVCHTDLHVLKNEVAFPRPAVLGHEVFGQVVALGPDTEETSGGIRVGDAVVGGFIMPCTTCSSCVAGRDDMCSSFFEFNRLRGTLFDGQSRLSMPDGSFLAMYSMGGLAEYAVVPMSALAVVPEAIADVGSAILGCAGMTAYGAAKRVADISPGQSVAIVGVGGIGSSLILMAKALGAGMIVAVDIAADKLDRARELGATHAVNSQECDAVEEVRNLSDGGCDVVFEALGIPTTFEQSVSMLADGGTMVAIGIAAAGSRGSIEITPLVRRGYTIAGSFGARTREDLPEVVRLAQSGLFDTNELITRNFPLEEVNDAYSLLREGRILGRALITMHD